MSDSADPTGQGSIALTENFDPAAYPKRLNLGCGWDKREGYLNIDLHDFHKPDLVGDVRDLAQLPSGYYDEIIAQDVLEHLERDEVDPALAEWSRLLRVGGTLIIRVPDIIGLAQVMSRLTTVDEQQTLIQNLYGTQAYTGDYHHAGFTELTLRHSLHEVGTKVTELVREDEWMFDCVAEKVTDTGPFDPGPLPFLQLCELDHASGERPELQGLGTVDRIMKNAAGRVPEGQRARLRSIWRPLRRRLAKTGLL